LSTRESPISGDDLPLVDRFRQDIVNGVYHPRERLVEADLAERYGAKRSTMRAAVLQLTSEGLVEREPNRGARVRALTVDEGIEVAQVRRELESLCARLAAERATEEERTRLAALNADLHAARRERDMPRYLRLNSAFHTMILEMSRQRVAADVVVRLGNLNFNRHFPMTFNTPAPETAEAEHDRLTQAILDGDGDAAAQAMHDHLQTFIEALRDTIRTSAAVSSVEFA
jgi:DNA-binding GntR family transcriptional regulator